MYGGWTKNKINVFKLTKTHDLCDNLLIKQDIGEIMKEVGNGSRWTTFEDEIVEQAVKMRGQLSIRELSDKLFESGVLQRTSNAIWTRVTDKKLIRKCNPSGEFSVKLPAGILTVDTISESIKTA